MPKNQLKLSVILCLFTLFLAACQFTPDDIYYIEIEEPQAPELEVIELNLDNDTIFLGTSKNIQFNFSAGQNHIVEVGILINGEQKYTRSNYKDNFTLKVEDLTEGFHKMTFSIVTNSNSGSIADLLGYEGFQFLSKEWTLVCVKNQRMAGYVTQTIENGKLKLSWEPHNMVDFKHYRIAKRRNDYSGIIKEYYTTEPHFIDEAFVGEEAHYDIYTEYHSSDEYYYHWAEFDIKSTLPNIEIRLADNGKYEIFWKNNAYIGAIGSYRLINLVTPADTVILQENEPTTDNKYIVPEGVFGDEIDYWLVVVPEKPENSFNNEAVYYHSTKYNGKLGEESFRYKQIAAIKNNELLAVDYNYGHIYRLSTTSNTPIDSLTYNRDNCQIGYSKFSLSPSGKYFTSKESCNNNIVLMAPDKLNNYQSYPSSKVIPEGLSFYSTPVSDNGIVVTKDYGKISVYDLRKDSVLTYYESDESVNEMGISSNGNYFYVDAHQLKFFALKDDTVSIVWESTLHDNYEYTNKQFDSTNPDNIILYDGKILYHKNASDFSTLKSFSLNEERIINFDLINRQLLAYSDGYLSVYSIDSGKRTFTLPVNPFIVHDQFKCTLAHNKIYIDEGICISINAN